MSRRGMYESIEDHEVSTPITILVLAVATLAFVLGWFLESKDPLITGVLTLASVLFYTVTLPRAGLTPRELVLFTGTLLALGGLATLDSMPFLIVVPIIAAAIGCAVYATHENKNLKKGRLEAHAGLYCLPVSRPSGREGLLIPAKCLDRLSPTHTHVDRIVYDHNLRRAYDRENEFEIVIRLHRCDPNLTIPPGIGSSC